MFVGGGGASSVVGVSVGSGNVGRTRCPRPSCRALALPLTPSSPPPPPVWPRPSCVAPPAPWCLTSRREGLHGVWAVSLCCCKWTKVVFGEEPPKIQPHLSSPPPRLLSSTASPIPSMVHLILSVKVMTLVFPAGVSEVYMISIRPSTRGSVAVIVLLVAAWLRCYTKFLPPPPPRLLPLMVHVVPGRLLASPIAAHLLILLLTFNLLFSSRKQPTK